MFTRATVAAFASLAVLATACSSGSSSGPPSAGGTLTPGALSATSSATGTPSASPGASGSPTPNRTAAGRSASGLPPNPAIATIDAHLDKEGKIIGPLPKTPKSRSLALITKAFKQLRIAANLLSHGVPGVPSSFTTKFVADINAVLSQESRDKECFRTRSKSVCGPVLKTAQQQFSTILDDRHTLDGYNP